MLQVSTRGTIMSRSGQRAGVQYSSSSGGGGGFSPVAYSKPEINAGEGAGPRHPSSRRPVRSVQALCGYRHRVTHVGVEKFKNQWPTGTHSYRSSHVRIVVISVLYPRAHHLPHLVLLGECARDLTAEAML